MYAAYTPISERFLRTPLAHPPGDPLVGNDYADKLYHAFQPILATSCAGLSPTLGPVLIRRLAGIVAGVLASCVSASVADSISIVYGGGSFPPLRNVGMVRLRNDYNISIPHQKRRCGFVLECLR